MFTKGKTKSLQTYELKLQVSTSHLKTQTTASQNGISIISLSIIFIRAQVCHHISQMTLTRIKIKPRYEF